MREASGVRVRVRVWLKRAREEGERAMMRREGLRVCLLCGKMRKGLGRGGDGGVKMFRSSSRNLDGGAASVITSSISFLEGRKEGWCCFSGL